MEYGRPAPEQAPLDIIAAQIDTLIDQGVVPDRYFTAQTNELETRYTCTSPDGASSVIRRDSPSGEVLSYTVMTHLEDGIDMVRWSIEDPEAVPTITRLREFEVERSDASPEELEELPARIAEHFQLEEEAQTSLPPTAEEDTDSANEVITEEEETAQNLKLARAILLGGMMPGIVDGEEYLASVVDDQGNIDPEMAKMLAECAVSFLFGVAGLSLSSVRHPYTFDRTGALPERHNRVAARRRATVARSISTRSRFTTAPSSLEIIANGHRHRYHHGNGGEMSSL